MFRDNQACLDVAFDMPELVCGLRQKLFSKSTSPRLRRKNKHIHGLICTRISSRKTAGTARKAREDFDRAAKAPSDYCFPARLEEMLVLQKRSGQMWRDAKAHIYLGNLLYDKCRREEAINIGSVPGQIDALLLFPGETWELHGTTYAEMQSALLDCYEKAFRANRQMRVCYMNSISFANVPEVPPAKRLSRLEITPLSCRFRDDLVVELVTLYNQN